MNMRDVFLCAAVSSGLLPRSKPRRDNAQASLRTPKTRAWPPLIIVLAGLLCAPGGRAHPQPADPALDLSRAVVVHPSNLSGPQKKALSMLIDEVEKRSRIRWPVSQSWPSDSTPVIAVGPASSMKTFAAAHAQRWSAEPGPGGAEGYRIRVETSGLAPAVFVIGNDTRGMLFGVGRLLRSLRMTQGAIRLHENLNIATVPKYPLRGHQLGYRPKTNS